MPSQSRKHRGLRTQKVVADYLSVNGFPWAESTGSGRSGSDITGVPGLAFEVKARAGFEPAAWMRQASMSQGLPMVTFRPNGIGETRIAEWPCIIRLVDLVALLRLSGYGDHDDGSTGAGTTQVPHMIPVPGTSGYPSDPPTPKPPQNIDAALPTPTSQET